MCFVNSVCLAPEFWETVKPCLMRGYDLRDVKFPEKNGLVLVIHVAVEPRQCPRLKRSETKRLP